MCAWCVLRRSIKRSNPLAALADTDSITPQAAGGTLVEDQRAEAGLPPDTGFGMWSGQLPRGDSDTGGGDGGGSGFAGGMPEVPAFSPMTRAEGYAGPHDTGHETSFLFGASGPSVSFNPRGSGTMDSDSSGGAVNREVSDV